MSDASLDILGPHRGPCAMCGGPDARHRIADEILDRWTALEPVQSIAQDLGLSERQVRGIVGGRWLEEPKPYPSWVCYPCGMKYGKRRPGDGWMATFHLGTCDVCGEKANVTQPRDFGHLDLGAK